MKWISDALEQRKRKCKYNVARNLYNATQGSEKGTIGQTFFSATVVDLWNALDYSTVSVDNVTALKES